MNNTKSMNVVNLSKRILTPLEHNVLSLGLSFCPTSSLDFIQTRIDLFCFIRKLKLRFWFLTKPAVTVKHKSGVSESNLCIADVETLNTLIMMENEGEMDARVGLEEYGVVTDKACPSQFKPKSVFNPNVINAAIDVFERAVVADIKALDNNNSRLGDNLSRGQRLAIRSLQQDDTIVIRQSDKGGNIVVWGRDDYVSEGLKQLGDRDSYREINKETIKETNEIYWDMLKEWLDRDLLEVEEFQFLKNLYPKIPIMYLIPKIHKNPLSPPGRPIISAMGSLLESTSSYIDHYLRPFVLSLQSYIRDSTDFIKQIQGIHWETEFKLLTMDVSSLYTCIDQQKGIQCCKHFLKTRPLEYLEHTEMFCTMLEFCLQHNFFMFDDKF